MLEYIECHFRINDHNRDNVKLDTKEFPRSECYKKLQLTFHNKKDQDVKHRVKLRQNIMRKCTTNLKGEILVDKQYIHNQYSIIKKIRFLVQNNLLIKEFYQSTAMVYYC